jgi:hypothetical protein
MHGILDMWHKTAQPNVQMRHVTALIWLALPVVEHPVLLVIWEERLQSIRLIGQRLQATKLMLTPMEQLVVQPQSVTVLT